MWHLRYYKTNEQYLEDVENEKIRLPYVIYNEETDKASWGRTMGDTPDGTMFLTFQAQGFTVKYDEDFVDEMMTQPITGETFFWDDEGCDSKYFWWPKYADGEFYIVTESLHPSVGDTVYYGEWGSGEYAPCGVVVPLDTDALAHQNENEFGASIPAFLVLMSNTETELFESVTINGEELHVIDVDGATTWCVEPSKCPEDGKVTLKCVIKGGDFTNEDYRFYIPNWLCSLTSVALGKGISIIPEDAFEDSWMLSEISFPSTLEIIGDSAFASCSSLTSIILPEGLKTIGDYAFAGCSSLTSIILPEGLKTIGDYAFSFWGEVGVCEKVVIPSTVTSIGEGAFDHLYGISEDGLMSPEDFINNSPLDAEEHGYWGAWVGDSMLYGSIVILNNKAINCGYGMLDSEMYEIPNNITGATSFSLSCLRNAGGAPGSRIKNITLHDTLVDVSDYAFGDERVYNANTYKIYLDSTALLDKLWVFEGATIYIAGEYAGTLIAGSINNGNSGYGYGSYGDSYGGSYGGSSYGSYGGPA